MEESLDAYFAMPAEQYPDLLEQLVAGLDSALQRYVTQTVNPCGEYHVLLSTNFKYHGLNRKYDLCALKLLL